MKRLLAYFLIIILLVSNAGIVVNAHFCMGELANVNWDVIENISSCHKNEDNDSKSEDDNSLDKMSCCDNFSERMSNDNSVNLELNYSSSAVTTSDHFISLVIIEKEFATESTNFNYLPPPLLFKVGDLQANFQLYLC